MNEAEERARIVAIARSFIGTPYAHLGRIKGPMGGIDCATLIYETFREAQLIGEAELPAYSPQWSVHHEEEQYTNFIRQFAVEVDRLPLPGDVVVWKFHRCFSHGAIVCEWPRIIHAYLGNAVMEDEADRNQVLTTVSERVPTQGQPRPMKTFSYWRSNNGPTTPPDVVPFAGHDGLGGGLY